jgi:hypothetical protein
VAKIEAWADPTDTGAVHVKTLAGTKIATLPVPANGHAEHWCAQAPEGGNNIFPLMLSVDAAVNGNGPLVTVWID